MADMLGNSVYGSAVSSLRVLVRAYPGAALALVAMTLLLRMLVPTGFMPTFQDGRLTVSICNGVGPAQMTVEIPGLKHQGEGHQIGSPCAFADLSLPSLAGADPIQLAELIGFLLALGLVLAMSLPPRGAARLQPPLRGPPLTS